MNAPHLIIMFNALCDYVRKAGEGYEPSPAATATHRLVCTRWNTPIKTDNPKLRHRDAKTRPEGFALAVCAWPITRQLKIGGKVKLATPIDMSKIPAYPKKGTLPGKRRVLAFMADHAAHPHGLRRLIRKMPNQKCDALYLSLLRSNRLAIKKWERLQRRLARKARRAAR